MGQCRQARSLYFAPRANGALAETTSNHCAQHLLSLFPPPASKRAATRDIACLCAHRWAARLQSAQATLSVGLDVYFATFNFGPHFFRDKIAQNSCCKICSQATSRPRPAKARHLNTPTTSLSPYFPPSPLLPHSDEVLHPSKQPLRTAFVRRPCHFSLARTLRRHYQTDKSWPTPCGLFPFQSAAPPNRLPPGPTLFPLLPLLQLLSAWQSAEHGRIQLATASRARLSWSSQLSALGSQRGMRAFSSSAFHTCPWDGEGKKKNAAMLRSGNG